MKNMSKHTYMTKQITAGIFLLVYPEGGPWTNIKNHFDLKTLGLGQTLDFVLNILMLGRPWT